MEAEWGFFVYRARKRVATRIEATVAVEMMRGREEFVLQEEDLVAVDCRRPAAEGCPGGGGDGPFLRLADGSGWVFEHKGGERVMEELSCTPGLWPYRVNKPAGLWLSRHPTFRADQRLAPPQRVGDGTTVWADMEVVDGATGHTFVKVQGSGGGWLSLGAESQMSAQLVLLREDEAQERVLAGTGRRGEHLPIPRVRALAARHNTVEVSRDDRLHLITFYKDIAGAGRVRWNVHYRTGSVGWVVSGAQHFERACDLGELNSILEDPVGCAEVRGVENRRGQDQGLAGLAPGGQAEEVAVRQALQQVGEEAAKLEARRVSLLRHLQAIEETSAEAVVAAEGETARKRELEAHVRRSRRRGTDIFVSMESPIKEAFLEASVRFDVGAASIALGHGYVALWDDLFLAPHSGLGVPREMMAALRQSYLPRIPPQLGEPLIAASAYVVLGPQGTWYMQLPDGKSAWSSACPQGFAALLTPLPGKTVKPVKRVAFGVGKYGNLNWLIIFEDGTFEGSYNLPKPLTSSIVLGRSNRRRVEDVTLGPDGQWFLLWRSRTGIADALWDLDFGDMPPTARDACQAALDSVIFTAAGFVRQVLFGASGSWAVRWSK